MKFKLEPCPFCESNRVTLHRNFDFVTCDSCGACGSFFDGHPEDAVNSWNTVSKAILKGVV